MADLHSKILDVRPPPPGSKFFQFHAVFGKIWQNRKLAPPPRGNPGSATGICFLFCFWLFKAHKLTNKHSQTVYYRSVRLQWLGVTGLILQLLIIYNKTPGKSVSLSFYWILRLHPAGSSVLNCEKPKFVFLINYGLQFEILSQIYFVTEERVLESN